MVRKHRPSRTPRATRCLGYQMSSPNSDTPVPLPARGSLATIAPTLSVAKGSISPPRTTEFFGYSGPKHPKTIPLTLRNDTITCGNYPAYGIIRTVIPVQTPPGHLGSRQKKLFFDFSKILLEQNLHTMYNSLRVEGKENHTWLPGPHWFISSNMNKAYRWLQELFLGPFRL